MNVSTPLCDDAAFGPVITGCRQDFDFTLSFQQYFFSVVPSAFLLLAGPLRILALRRQVAKVDGNVLKYTKLVYKSLYSNATYPLSQNLTQANEYLSRRAQLPFSPVSNWPCSSSGRHDNMFKVVVARRLPQLASHWQQA